MLDDRKQLILKAVVDDYIATSEPVGSKAIVQNHGLNFSSATVRNCMADLEKKGYLIQPHTSSGRVPSDKGYRAYVDALMDLTEVPEDEKREIEHELAIEQMDMRPLLKKAVKILSQTTGCTALAVMPHGSRSRLKQLKILMIEPGRALMVVVMHEGLVKNRMARVPNNLSLEQLMDIAQIVEQHLSGLKLEDITLVTVETSAQGIELPDSLLNQVLYEAYVSIKQAEHMETYTEGLSNLLHYPELRNMQDASELVDVIAKEGGMIAGRFQQEAKDQSVQDQALMDLSPTSMKIRSYPDYFMIRIGQEIALDSLDQCSFLTSSYWKDDQVLGHISVVGPKRMQYNQIISRITFVRDTVQHLMEQHHMPNDDHKNC